MLGAVLRQLAVLGVAQRLRDVDPIDSADASRSDAADGSGGVSDDELPLDPWRTSGDAATRVLEHAGALFEALAEQRTVADLFQAIGALDESEVVAIVLERALAEIAVRTRPTER